MQKQIDTPKPHSIRTPSPLENLQKFESQIRKISKRQTLLLHLLNAFCEYLKIDLAIAIDGSKRRPKPFAASNVSELSPDSPFVQNLAKSLKVEIASQRVLAPFTLKLEGSETPLPFAHFVPLNTYSKAAPLGVVFAKSSPWTESQRNQVLYFVDLYAHAFKAINTSDRSWVRKLYRGIGFAGILAALTALIFVHVPITITAPARVLPKNGLMLTSPVSGKIVNVAVDQGDWVRKGQKLITFDDTVARDQLKLAQQKMSVALSKKSVLSKKSLIDPLAREELSIAETEAKLAEIEVQRAQHNLEQFTIRAPRDGQIYADAPRELIEKSVSIGDSLIEIITPSELYVQSDVDVKDGTLAFEMRSARIFLNTSPLNPVDLIKAGSPLKPILDERGNVSYPIPLDFVDPVPSLSPGIEGTAQLFGKDAPLGYVIFRRPINWLRTLVPKV